MQSSLRYRHGWSVRQRCCDCPRRPARGSTWPHERTSPARLCVRLPPGRCLCSSSRQHDLSRMATPFLVWSLPTDPVHHLASHASRDTRVPAARKRPPRRTGRGAKRQQDFHRRRQGRHQASLGPARVPGPPYGRLQLHVARIPGPLSYHAYEPVRLQRQPGHRDASCRQCRSHGRWHCRRILLPDLWAPL